MNQRTNTPLFNTASFIYLEVTRRSLEKHIINAQFFVLQAKRRGSSHFLEILIKNAKSGSLFNLFQKTSFSENVSLGPNLNNVSKR